MLTIIKIIIFLLLLLTLRAIVPRYKVDILATVMWKHLLVVSSLLLMVTLI